MKKTLFCGCSFVAGTGFDLEKNDPLLWVNLLHQNNNYLKETELYNIGSGGRSNQNIFLDAASALVDEKFEYAFVCWTSWPRYEINCGLELYPTKLFFSPNSLLYDINLNDISYSKKYLDSIRNRFLSLLHPHDEIIKIIQYVNTLINLSKLTDTKIFFVNSLCLWDKNYFDKIENCMPEQYTKFTKNIINVNNRDDSEIYKLYNQIHTDYKNKGGIRSDYWLNLYNSLKDNTFDTNTDNKHPGYKSNQTFYSFLNQQLNSLLH